MANNLESNLAQKILDKRKRVTKTSKLIRIARGCDYQVKNKGCTDGHLVYDGCGTYLTTIPHHRMVKWPTARGILTSLATGISHYRKRRL